MHIQEGVHFFWIYIQVDTISSFFATFHKIQWLSTARAEGMVAIYYGVPRKKRWLGVDKIDL